MQKRIVLASTLGIIVLAGTALAGTGTQTPKTNSGTRAVASSSDKAPKTTAPTTSKTTSKKSSHKKHKAKTPATPKAS